MTSPHADRPSMPSGYGIASGDDGQLAWSWVERECTRSRNYWICTTRPDGRPHAIPVWGLWLDGAVLFSTDPESTKARNFTARPEAVIHLESGDEVVVLEGRIEPMDRALLPEFVKRYEKKYSFRPSETETAGVFSLRPERVLAWREKDFPTSATRFRPA
jgi:pyridoxamine 5'-phosphate oxidase-like protein